MFIPLLRPASPRALWQDIRAFWSTRTRHQWIAAILALVIPAVIVIGFIADSRYGIMPGEQVIYVKSWPANRSEAEIRAQQQADLARLNRLREERRQAFQRLDSSLNRLGI
jgi:hypothetical protein